MLPHAAQLLPELTDRRTVQEGAVHGFLVCELMDGKALERGTFGTKVHSGQSCDFPTLVLQAAKTALARNCAYSRMVPFGSSVIVVFKRAVLGRLPICLTHDSRRSVSRQSLGICL